MTLKDPRFWYESSPSLLARGLRPFSWIFQAFGQCQSLWITPKEVPCPLICVGNLTVGGAGKTPTVLKIADILRSQKKSVHFLTRGYGGRLKEPVQVSLDHHTHEDVGDEALLLAQAAPTWVSADRYEGAKRAYESGASLIIMDDGFQNPSLTKNLNLVVVDSLRGVGNGLVLPAGPLRETLYKGLDRAQGVILIGSQKQAHESLKFFDNYLSQLPILKAQLRPTEASLEKFKNNGHRLYTAFCGIGNPEKFFTTLREISLNVLQTFSFPDHYPYTVQDIRSLVEKAQDAQSRLVTTRKDWVRLPLEYRSQVDVLDITLEFEDEASIASLIKTIETA